MKRVKGLLLTLCVSLALTACAKEDVRLNEGMTPETDVETIDLDADTLGNNADITKEDSGITGVKDEAEKEGSSDDITIEVLLEMTSVKYQVDTFGSYCFTQSYSYDDYPDVQGPSNTYTCAKNPKGYYEISVVGDYGDGTCQLIYENDDPDDLYIYMASDSGVERFIKDEDQQEFAKGSTFFGREDSRLISVDRSEGTIIAVVDTYYAGEKEDSYEIVIDEVTTKILKASAHNDMANISISYEFDYDSEAMIDTSAKDKCIEYYGDAVMADTLIFDTVDINGNHVTEEMIKGSKVVLLNLWSATCGASIENNPNLQKLYDKYKDQGLLIIGVYSSMDDSADVKDVVDKYGITYPIISPDINLALYVQASSGSTPASFIFDGDGKLLESAPNIGYHSLETWDDIIKDYL